MPDQVSGLLSPWLRQQRIKAVLPYLEGRILDFGCGVGQLTRYCDKDLYIGYDIDSESIATAKNLYSKFQFTNKLPQEGSFKTIVLLAVIEHLKEPAKVLSALKSIMSVGSRIVLTTPHPRFHFALEWGAYLGMLSRHAQEEHEDLIDKKSMQTY